MPLLNSALPRLWLCATYQHRPCATCAAVGRGVRHCCARGHAGHPRHPGQARAAWVGAHSRSMHPRGGGVGRLQGNVHNQVFGSPSPCEKDIKIPKFDGNSPQCCSAKNGGGRAQGGGFGKKPWSCVLVCSWRRPLADRHSLPFPSLSFSEGPPSRCFGPPFLFLHGGGLRRPKH